MEAGYIRVYQDVRGKYGSDGAYLMTRPPRGPMNATATDDTTDAYDTIDWLVKHLPESNGKVGMIGSSYDGWTVVTEDGSPAAHFEHTVAITSGGPWVLTAADGGREGFARLAQQPPRELAQSHS